MILRGAEGDDGDAVGQCEEADFLPVEERLNHHGGTRFPEQRVDRRLGFGDARGDRHALARREAVGLDHHRQAEAGERKPCRRRIGMALERGSRNAVPRAQILGETLRPF